MIRPPLAPRAAWTQASGLRCLTRQEAAMGRTLRDWLRVPSVSGAEGPFTRLVADWCTRQGFTIDLWQARESKLPPHRSLGNRHLPLANRPTLVAKLPGSGHGRSLIFNAHADVVDAPHPERWSAGPWSGALRQGWIHGRGACDVKGPLVSALWAMLAARELAGDGLAGDVLLELVPGEEDCVGLGTLTSIARGVKADAAVILEPTECLPRCASRAGCRFDITSRGRAIHGTVKWEGRDAIRLARAVLDALDTLEARWNDRRANALFDPYPIARPITVDKVSGGRWQGMICDECVCAGYLELLPEDSISDWERRFEKELVAEVVRRGRDAGNVEIQFTERYDGHCTSSQSPLCQIAMRATVGKHDWSAFNSGCEAGTRANLLGTPTLVWGPGSLSLAHADNERIRFSDVRRVAASFTRLILDWCGEPVTKETE